MNLPLTIRNLIPRDLVASVDEALSLAEEWGAALPRESTFYTYERATLRTPIRGTGVSARKQNIADILWDVHSMLTGLLLTKSWLLQQLAEGLRSGLGSWNLTMCALTTRALVESAASWWIEEAAIETTWFQQKSIPPNDPPAAACMRRALIDEMIQPTVATRRGRDPQAPKAKDALVRRNVQTLIQKTEKSLPRPGLFGAYEVLCDAVHPSWGQTSSSGATSRSNRALA